MPTLVHSELRMPGVVCSPLDVDHCSARESVTCLPRVKIYCAACSRRIRKIGHQRGRCCLIPGSAPSCLDPRYPGDTNSRRVMPSPPAERLARYPLYDHTPGGLASTSRGMGPLLSDLCSHSLGPERKVQVKHSAGGSGWSGGRRDRVNESESIRSSLR